MQRVDVEKFFENDVEGGKVEGKSSWKGRNGVKKAFVLRVLERRDTTAKIICRRYRE